MELPLHLVRLGGELQGIEQMGVIAVPRDGIDPLARRPGRALGAEAVPHGAALQLLDHLLGGPAHLLDEPPEPLPGVVRLGQTLLAHGDHAEEIAPLRAQHEVKALHVHQPLGRLLAHRGLVEEVDVAPFQDLDLPALIPISHDDSFRLVVNFPATPSLLIANPLPRKRGVSP